MLAAVMSRVKEHTLGCFSSPKLCKPVAKQSAGAVGSATGKVLAHNSSEEDQRFPVGGGMLRSMSQIHRHFLHFLEKNMVKNIIKREVKKL